MQRVGDLEINEDAGFAERGWKLQKAAWVLMLLFAVCAFLGLTGSGPLARAAVTAPDFRLEYARFLRVTAASALIIRFEPIVVQNGEVNVWLGRDYLSAFQIESIMPEPESVVTSADRLIYTFRTLENQPGEITFHLKGSAGSFGLIRGEAGITPSRQVGFRQFVYP
jgi:hypothetical protein